MVTVIYPPRYLETHFQNIPIGFFTASGRDWIVNERPYVLNWQPVNVTIKIKEPKMLTVNYVNVDTTITTTELRDISPGFFVASVLKPLTSEYRYTNQLFLCLIHTESNEKLAYLVNPGYAPFEWAYTWDDQQAPFINVQPVDVTITVHGPAIK